MPVKQKSHSELCWPRRGDDPQRPSPWRRGYRTNWPKLRLMQLRREPLCRICALNGAAAAATEVDHIQPKAKGGADSFENLQSLCKPCHSKKTMAERYGGA